MDLLTQVNELLLKGYSVEQASQELGKGKEWARRQLSSMGYKYNRNTKQYELKDITKATEIKQEKQEITKVTTNSYEMKTQEQKIFNDSDIDILYKLIEEYKIRNTVMSDRAENDTLSNRNIRVYKNHYEKFANWCKRNNVTQADALKKAIDLLLNGVTEVN